MNIKMPVGAAILEARKLLPLGYTIVIEVVSENINVSLRTPHAVVRGDLMRSVTCQIQELIELAVREVER